MSLDQKRKRAHEVTNARPEGDFANASLIDAANRLAKLFGFADRLEEYVRAMPAGRREAILSALIAGLATFLFYVQALSGGSLNAGFVYTGDFWHVWLAQVAKINSLVLHGTLTGIDYSTHGGASELFLRSNLYPYHPLLLLYSVLNHTDTPQRLIRFSVLLLVFHSYLGCYFSLRLASRYLRLGIGAAAFIALGFTFSVQMFISTVFPPFVLCIALLPWVVYAALSFSERPSVQNAMLWSIPTFMVLLGGYIPMAITCLALALGFVTAYILYIDRAPNRWSTHGVRLGTAAIPTALGLSVVAPLYWSILNYYKFVPASTFPSIFFSAHQLAERPRTFVRMLSSRSYYPGPASEFTLVCGFIPIVISIIFFTGLRASDLSEREWRLFKVAACLYVFVVLAIYGDYSAVSDLLYLIPAIGTMHIYQRHLIAAHLFFVIFIAVMLVAVRRRVSRRPVKFTLLFVSAVFLVCAHLLAVDSPIAAALHLNDYLILELFAAVLFTVAALLPGTWFMFGVGAFLIMLTPLNHMYDFSTSPEKAYAGQFKEHLNLDKEVNKRVLSYFRDNSNKAIIKYIDVTAGTVNYFSRNYPWFVALDLPLSSYGGYDFLLAQRSAYHEKMVFTVPRGENTWLMRPDWTWVARTGGEFVLYKEGYAFNDPFLPEVVDLRDPSKVLRLPNNLVIAPLRFQPEVFRGGNDVRGRYVRVQLTGKNYLSLAEVRVNGLAAGRLTELAHSKKATQSSGISGSQAQAARAVDGDTNGDFNAGSVTHTQLEQSPWWEVDLGESFSIDSVEVWNRTDSAVDRLSDYWIFTSDQPFRPNDKPESLKDRAGVFSTHQLFTPRPSAIIRAGRSGVRTVDQAVFDNGYLRVLGTEKSASVNSFRTDGAASLALDINSPGPTKVEYLFWPNDRLRFYVNGSRVKPVLDRGLQTLPIPAGNSHIEIHYVYWPLRIFLLFYLMYAIAVLVAACRSTIGWANSWRLHRQLS